MRNEHNADGNAQQRRSILGTWQQCSVWQTPLRFMKEHLGAGGST